MREKDISFRFKGERDYVHGTDAFNAIVDHFTGEKLSNIRLFIHDFIKVPTCTMRIFGAGEDSVGEGRAEIECNLTANGQDRVVTIQSSPTSNKPERQEYDENEIIKLCHIENESIELRGNSPYTFVESIVAMTKQLHLCLFPDAVGRWVFVRLELNSYTPRVENVKLIFRHNLNFRLTRSEIEVGEDRLGDIYFSLVKT